jgi:hypothetical protein
VLLCCCRYGDDHDSALDATAMRNIMRTERFKTRDLDVDEEYDNDAGLEVRGPCIGCIVYKRPAACMVLTWQHSGGLQSATTSARHESRST